MKKNNYKKKWLAIENWVYAAIRNEYLLLYNTRSGKYIISKEKQHIAIIANMHEKKNLGVILFEKEWAADIVISQFINEAVEKNIFSFENYQENMLKPIRLMPILNIQKVKKEVYRSVGESSLHYFTELSIYVNNSCALTCNHCNQSCKQFTCCCRNENGVTLDNAILTKIATQIKYAPILKLNIIGGDIFSYPLLNKISEIFNEKKEQIHYWSHYKNFRANDMPVIWDILIDFPVNEQILLKCISTSEKKKTHYHFIVQNEKEFNLVETIINNLDIQNSKIYPYYNNNNIDFFKTCIFLDKEDIFEDIITQRQIFCNQVLNSNFFGGFTILSNGDVVANMNTPVLGNIFTSSLLELITNELEQNTAWRKIRNEKPCNECLYQYLCPPVSNYEMIFNKQNLCTLY